MALNLYNYLTELDNKRIENYVRTYGTASYIGNEIYLSDWRDCKKKLFKLLDGQLIYSFPIELDKDEIIIRQELSDLISTHDFATMYDDLYYAYLDKLTSEERRNYNDHWGMLTTVSNLFSNKVPDPATILKEDPDTGVVKSLKITPGMKIFRAIRKIIDFLEPEDEEIHKSFEDFRIAHSMILNDKKLRGELCFSIHPIDFMTMSDNANNWSSCMSWVDGGCYHTGTVEMMNSNLVICVYLKSDKEFNFSLSKNKHNEEDWIWNSKKWRQLFYCNKDIIVSGKAYPFNSKDLTFIALNKLRELAKKNWNQEYKYGIEQYRDMIHINTLHKMNLNRMWAKGMRNIKHNIIFDTNGMYNDMFNDRKTPYWCVRNKVKKNTMLNLSGKVRCACCGEYNVINQVDYDYLDEYEREVENLSEDDMDDYNSQYSGVKKVICRDCYQSTTCDLCDNIIGDELLKIENKIFYHAEVGPQIIKTKVCKSCFTHNYVHCPTCGELFNIFDFYNRRLARPVIGLYKDLSEFKDFSFNKYIQPLEISLREGWTGDRIEGSTMRFNECPRCTVERIRNKTTEKEITYNSDTFYGNNSYTAYINNEIMTEETAKKYYVENLRRASEEEFYQLLRQQRENKKI